MAKRVMKDKSGLPKKFLAMLPPGWREDADAMSPSKLKELIVQCQGTRQLNQQEQSEDERLANARTLVKDLNSGYAEVEKIEKAKTRYAIHRLTEMGISVGIEGAAEGLGEAEDDSPN